MYMFLGHPLKHSMTLPVLLFAITLDCPSQAGWAIIMQKDPGHKRVEGLVPKAAAREHVYLEQVFEIRQLPFLLSLRIAMPREKSFELRRLRHIHLEPLPLDPRQSFARGPRREICQTQMSSAQHEFERRVPVQAVSPEDTSTSFTWNGPQPALPRPTTHDGGDTTAAVQDIRQPVTPPTQTEWPGASLLQHSKPYTSRPLLPIGILHGQPHIISQCKPHKQT
jgi:hypothetical protein